jgi:hypothetical protein
MSRRSAIETAVGVLSAFFDRRSWPQAALARHLDLSPRALRKHLEEMQRSGIPFQRELDTPHVYWSLPNGWVPGALLLQGEEVAQLLQLLCRLPASPSRDRLLERITSAAPARAAHARALESVVHTGAAEAGWLDLVTGAAAERRTPNAFL